MGELRSKFSGWTDMVVLGEDMPESGCLVSSSADGSRDSTRCSTLCAERGEEALRTSSPKDRRALGQGPAQARPRCVTSAKPLPVLGPPPHHGASFMSFLG